MNTPWAESNKYRISQFMSFTAERLPSVDSPSRPFCVRFKGPLRGRHQHYGFTASYRHAATLDTEPLAKRDFGRNRTRLSSNHFQSARAFDRYACSGTCLIPESAFESLVECPWSHDTAATNVVPEATRSNQKLIEWWLPVARVRKKAPSSLSSAGNSLSLTIVCSLADNCANSLS